MIIIIILWTLSRLILEILLNNTLDKPFLYYNLSF